MINVSEGRRADVVDSLAVAGGNHLLDLHGDPGHHRTVLTLAGPDLDDVARAVTRVAVDHIDVRDHAGAHPRIGAVDVVPFVPLSGSSFDDAVAARDEFAAWAGADLGVPCFLYGPERTLPEIRRSAFTGLSPDVGPPSPHPTAGAMCVGARPVLVAYNLWLAEPDLATARDIATAIRSTEVRALGLDVTGHVQVSMNLLDPTTVTPADVYDAVASRATVARAELVGLAPAAVLGAVPEERWAELDLDPSTTIERRLARAGW